MCVLCPDEGAVPASEPGRPGGAGVPAGPRFTSPPLIPVRLQQTTTGQVLSKPVRRLIYVFSNMFVRIPCCKLSSCLCTTSIAHLAVLGEGVRAEDVLVMLCEALGDEMFVKMDYLPHLKPIHNLCWLLVLLVNFTNNVNDVVWCVACFSYLSLRPLSTFSFCIH